MIFTSLFDVAPFQLFLCLNISREVIIYMKGQFFWIMVDPVQLHGRDGRGVSCKSWFVQYVFHNSIPETFPIVQTS